MAGSGDWRHHRRSRWLRKRASPAAARSRRSETWHEAVRRLQRCDVRADLSHDPLRDGRVSWTDARGPPRSWCRRLRCRVVPARADETGTDGGADRARARHHSRRRNGRSALWRHDDAAPRVAWDAVRVLPAIRLRPVLGRSGRTAVPIGSHGDAAPSERHPGARIGRRDRRASRLRRARWRSHGTSGHGRSLCRFSRTGAHRLSVRAHDRSGDNAAARRVVPCRGRRRAAPRRGGVRGLMKIHLIGVCGTAMATLAAMLKRNGLDVQGSDQDVYPPMSDFLAAEGIPALTGYRPEHVTSDIDVVIVGNAISRGNPELEEVLDRKIRYCSLPEAIREHFLWGARSIVIAGTHGKTTTTSLAGWLLTHGGLDPSVLVGGIARNFGPDGGGGSSYRIGAGRDFVIEGDEYDSAFFDKTAKFLKYLPDIAVVNNVEFDHADIYADFEAVELAFRRLVNL